ncbi:MAG: hypothetical protein HY391_03530 [Deltaproteobacteria bacterium]|nr:hypothetical protein [Deltaproteobacteria bacterium]
MKTLLAILSLPVFVVIVMGAASSFCAADEIPIASFCVLKFVEGENSNEARAFFSCDGNQRVLMDPILPSSSSSHEEKEVSGQVNKFLAKGYRVINCVAGSESLAYSQNGARSRRNPLHVCYLAGF